MKTQKRVFQIEWVRILNLIAALCFVGAVFKISADQWEVAIIYFVLASVFVSLKRVVFNSNQGRKNHRGSSDSH